MNPIIKLSDKAALRIKEIMADAEKDSIGVRVSVKSGGCAGMSYVMEYTKELNPNDEIIEDNTWHYLNTSASSGAEQVQIVFDFSEVATVPFEGAHGIVWKVEVNGLARL